MTSPQTQPSTPRSSDRTRLITLASIVVVGLAGATAVSANMGILDAASDSNVGTASAAGDLTPVTQVIDVYLPSTTTHAVTATPTTDSTGVQVFTVDAAGTVALMASASGLTLDSVSPAGGWTWGLTQTSATDLTITFTNGVRVLEFNASMNPDGTILATVNEPIVVPAPPNTTRSDDDDDDDDDDSDEHEDEDHEYEGGEDDD